MIKRLMYGALGVLMAVTLAACSQVSGVPVRTDTVANACEDVAGLFYNGLEQRLAGMAAPKIEEFLLEQGASPLEATVLTAQVMAQTLPRLAVHKERFLKDAYVIMDQACMTASAVEPFIGEVEVRPKPKP